MPRNTGGTAPTNDEPKQYSSEDRGANAYALSAAMLLVFSILILAAHATVSGKNFASVNWQNVYLSASVITIFGCLCALIFYCCDIPAAMRYIIAVFILVGGILYLVAGGVNSGHFTQSCSTTVGRTSECNQLRGYFIALPLFVMVECIILAMQIATDIIDEEKRRIAAQVCALFIYGMCRAFYWYGFTQNDLNAAQKAAEAGLMILMIVCVVVLMFHTMCCNVENKIFRIITGVFMCAAALIYLSAWIALTGQNLKYINSSGTAATRLQVMAPAVFVFLETVALAVEVGYVG